MHRDDDRGPSFLSAANLENVLRQVSINAIIAVGMTCVILTGGIDLSVGSVMALSGTLAAGLMVAGVNAVAALAIGIAVGLGFGFLNGVFVAFAGCRRSSSRSRRWASRAAWH